MTKKKGRYSGAEKIYTTLIIIILAANICSIHTFSMTVISWSGFIITSFLLGCIVSAVMLIIVHKQKARHADKSIAQKLAMSIITGQILYLLVFSFIPFGINYYFAPGETTQENIGVTTYEIEKVKDGDKTYSYEYCWTYKNVDFSRTSSTNFYGSSVNLEVQKGLFGWEIIWDWEID